MDLKSRHSITAEVNGVPIGVVKAAVQLDEGWSPYVQVQLECSLPDAATLANLDPRTGARVTLRARQEFGQSASFDDFNALYAGMTIAEFNALWTGRTFDDFNASVFTPWNSFGVRGSVDREMNLLVVARVIDRRDKTLNLKLESDEASLLNNALVATSPVSPGGTSVRGAVQYALSRIGATLEPGGADATVDADALIWLPGVTAWNYLTPLVQAGNLRLYCDEMRRWYLVPSGTITDGLILVGAGQNATAATDTVSSLDNAEFYTGVVITYKWTDAFDLVATAYDVAGTDTKVLAITYELPYPGPGAAAGILARAAGRGRVFDLEAVSDYLTEPGKNLVATLPDTPIQTGFVSAVEWRFPENRMSVKSRGLTDTPLHSWLLAPTGRQWNSVAPGVTWATYTP